MASVLSTIKKLKDGTAFVGAIREHFDGNKEQTADFVSLIQNICDRAQEIASENIESGAVSASKTIKTEPVSLKVERLLAEARLLREKFDLPPAVSSFSAPYALNFHQNTEMTLEDIGSRLREIHGEMSVVQVHTNFLNFLCGCLFAKAMQLNQRRSSGNRLTTAALLRELGTPYTPRTALRLRRYYALGMAMPILLHTSFSYHEVVEIASALCTALKNELARNRREMLLTLTGHTPEVPLRGQLVLPATNAVAEKHCLELLLTFSAKKSEEVDEKGFALITSSPDLPPLPAPIRLRGIGAAPSVPINGSAAAAGIAPVLAPPPTAPPPPSAPPLSGRRTRMQPFKGATQSFPAGAGAGAGGAPGPDTMTDA